MEEFIRILTEQIRCTEARDDVAREIGDHILDQAEALEENGMGREEALAEAVRRMGDPVEIGAQLDRIHRPRTDWKMLLLAAACSLGGFFLQYLSGGLSLSPGMGMRQWLYMGIGLALMAGIYFLDYGFIGRYAKGLYLALIAAVAAYVLLTPAVNGMHRGAMMPMYLFVPVFGGILYRYRGQGWSGAVRSLLWMAVPVWESWSLIPSLVTAVDLFLILGCMLLTAAVKGWFGVDKRKMTAMLVGIGAVLPAVSGALGYRFMMADHQKARIAAFLNPREYMYQAGYIYCVLRDMLSESRWIGGAGNYDDTLFLADGSYLLAHVVATYGLLLGLVVVIALAAVCVRAFRISVRQKNQLGLMVGMGCGLVFLVMGAEGIGVNLGLLPSTTVLLPFLTYGGTATVCYDILIGLLLSIYRYQNITSDRKTAPRWRLSLRVERDL